MKPAISARDQPLRPAPAAPAGRDSRSAATGDAGIAGRKSRSRLARLGIIAALLAALFVFRHPLMTLAARAWMVSDPLEAADAVVVLGGSLDSRPFIAGELYKRGLAPLILVAESRRSPATEANVLPTDAAAAASILRRMGVPDSAVQRFGDGVASTREEAVALRRWIESHPARRFIIPTDPFHSRRARIIFDRELKGLPVRLTVTSIPNKRYDPLQWWKSEEAAIRFQNEIAKLVYYWIHE